MTKKAIFSFILISILAGCASILNTPDRTIKQVRLDMTREQVVGIMGNDYTIKSAVKTRDGNMEEVLEWYTYDSGIKNQAYQLFFLNNRLKEWHVRNLNENRHHHNNNNRPSRPDHRR